MRKLLLIFALIFLFTQSVYALEEISSPDEVTLEAEQSLHDELGELGIETAPEQTEINHEKSLKEKWEDIWATEYTDLGVNNYLLTNIVTKHFSEDSIVESIHPFGGYNGSLGMEFNDNDSFQAKYGFNAINLGVDGKFRGGKSDFRVLFTHSPLSSRNLLRNSFSDIYIGTNKIKNHRIQVGYQRPASGIEGKMSSFQLPFVYRSQISRTFGTVRKAGARVIGNYSLFDYDIGGYSSDTYFKSFFPGAEFAGWINIKPLGKTNGKYGNLKIGSGIQSGRRDTDYTVSGFYIGYDYKKFMANFEWANANGYNGRSGHTSNKHASGFYTTLGYMITPKVQVLARYDELDSDKKTSNNSNREYSFGLNYFIKGQGLKLMLNYIFCQNDSAKDSHRLILGTQILL
ncbi:MAG: porin family protein [bacterium]|nr:porin family protein [bacterium]